MEKKAKKDGKERMTNGGVIACDGDGGGGGVGACMVLPDPTHRENQVAR